MKPQRETVGGGTQERPRQTDTCIPAESNPSFMAKFISKDSRYPASKGQTQPLPDPHGEEQWEDKFDP